MNRRRTGLGSGLDALFSAQPVEGQPALRMVAISDVRPNPRQPRTQFDEQALDELAASIREHGLIQPLIVSSQADAVEGYELIAGERRWRAAQRAGLSEVPVVVREAAAQQILEIALIENIQRADLNPLEEARAYQALVDDFGLSDGEIAKRMGKGSREAIANTRRLLQLDSDVQAVVLQGQISAGHGRAILKAKTAEHQRAVAWAVMQHELSVRATERLADLIVEHHGDLPTAIKALRGSSLRAQSADVEPQQTKGRSIQPAMQPAITPDDEEVRRSLEQILSTPVTFNRTERELRITIAFHTEEKLQEFFDWINNR
jgi:ParB family transcriptional regulator, chromosome partitioning protein